MWKSYENFHTFHFQKRIVSAETIGRNTVFENVEACPVYINCNWMILTSINSFAVLSPLLQTHALKKIQSIHRCMNQFMISEVGKKKSKKRWKTIFSCHRLILIHFPGSGMKYSQLYQQTYLFNTCLKFFESLKTSIAYPNKLHVNWCK